jgi:hypothetical protein
MESRVYIDTNVFVYLIPIRIQEIVSGTVYNISTSLIKLVVRQKKYFKDPIIIELGVDFLLIIVY